MLIRMASETRITGFVSDLNFRNPDIYAEAITFFEKIFTGYSDEMQEIRDTAREIRAGIEKISPFVQEATQVVCPECRDICCISKHGYYNYEDLIYIYAIGQKPAEHDFNREDSAPCQFLSETGCLMERTVRPSGCNWYFCGPLFDHMGKMPAYREFDENLGHVAGLWIEMSVKFSKAAKQAPS